MPSQELRVRYMDESDEVQQTAVIAARRSEVGSLVAEWYQTGGGPEVEMRLRKVGAWPIEKAREIAGIPAEPTTTRMATYDGFVRQTEEALAEQAKQQAKQAEIDAAEAVDTGQYL